MSAQTTLYNGGHEEAPWGFTLGYVNKYWTTDIEGTTVNENLWGQEGKRLHGFQMGMTYSPCLPMGLGFDTGLHFECYISDSEVVHEAGFDDFTESNIYIPVHAMYRIPFDRNKSLSIYGGFGMNIVLEGTYNVHDYFHDWMGTYESTYVGGVQVYNEGDWPNRFNFQWELGAKLRISNIILNASYAWGATNHKFYEGYKTHQNKLSIGLGYVCDF